MCRIDKFSTLFRYYYLFVRFSFFLSRAPSFTHTHIHTGCRQWEQMSCSHLKKILPNLSIISPLSQSCQHNRQDRITDGSLSFFEKKPQKRGTHHLTLFLSRHSSPPPAYKAHWVERENEEWEGGEGRDIMHMKMSWKRCDLCMH